MTALLLKKPMDDMRDQDRNTFFTSRIRKIDFNQIFKLG